MAGESPPTTRKGLRAILAVAATAWVLVVLGIFGVERWRLHANRDEVAMTTDPADPLLRFRMPGIVRPSTVEARLATLRPDTPVIGVEVGGRARAYRLDALRDRSKHLVNDVVGTSPVSVAYCDLADCVSVFRGREDGGPIDLAVGGLYEGRELVLDFGGALYFQGSGTPVGPALGPPSLPLARVPATRTTWGEWKRLHPSTDVYEGVR